MEGMPDSVLDDLNHEFPRDAYKEPLSTDEMQRYLAEYPGMASKVASSCPEHRVLALAVNGMALQFVPKRDQTLMDVETALRQTGRALQFASRRILRENPWLYKTAIRSSGYALKSVPEEHRYEGIYKEAVTNEGGALWMVPSAERTREICLLAVRSSWGALEYVPYSLIDEEIALSAVSQDGFALSLIPPEAITEGVACAAVRRFPGALEWVPPRLMTDEMVRSAVSDDPRALEWVPGRLRTAQLLERAVSLDWTIIWMVKRPSKKLLLLAFEQSPRAIQYFPEKWKTESISLEAYRRDVTTVVYLPLEYVSLSMVEECLEHLSGLERPLSVAGMVELLEHVDRSWLRQGRIATMLRELGLRRTISASWDGGDSSFRVLESISYRDPEECPEQAAFSGPLFQLESRPRGLDQLIDLLGGDLSRVEFGDYPFNDYDPSKHDLTYAHVPLGTLKRIGAYDDTAYQSLVASGDSLRKDAVSDAGEIITASAHAELLAPYDMSVGLSCYYVSDLHLDHKLARRFPSGATKLEIHEHVEAFVQSMVSEVPLDDRRGSPLLVLGDTTCSIDVATLFYSTLRSHWPGTILVTLGNHELWDYRGREGLNRPTPSVTDVTCRYRKMLKELGIHLLQDDVVFRYRGRRFIHFDQSALERLDDSKLQRILGRSSLIFLGGIGFSGLCEEFNASTGIYRDTVSTVREDLDLSAGMSNLHERIRLLAPKGNVIVATHMPLRCWSEAGYQSGWVYVSGHTHRNTFSEDGPARVYEDNQLGYGGTRPRLLRFLVERRYDPFSHLADGLHKIERMDYRDFNRARGIPVSSFSREGEVLMLKREGVYLFLFVWEKTGDLYLLSGGRIKRLEVQDPWYYYRNMPTYCSMVKEAFSGYQNAIRRIGSEVKQIGGSGHVHGCIVDIDFFNHIYLDPFSGKLTYYNAWSVDDRVEYHDIRTLLLTSLPELLPGLDRLPGGEGGAESEKPLILRGTDLSIAESAAKTDTLMYKPSRTMLSIQYLFDSNVIRIWNDEALGIAREKDSSKQVGKLPAAAVGERRYLPAGTGGKGRPSMKMAVGQWRKDHPNGSPKKCAEEIGASYQTVLRWWKQDRFE